MLYTWWYQASSAMSDFTRQFQISSLIDQSIKINIINMPTLQATTKLSVPLSCWIAIYKWKKNLSQIFRHYNGSPIFMSPRSRIGGRRHIVIFCHSVTLSSCHSVLHSETLTLLIIFEQWVLELWYPCDKSFPWASTFFNPQPWPWNLIYFLKTLTLLITFEHGVLELWYFLWEYLVTKPASSY